MMSLNMGINSFNCTAIIWSLSQSSLSSILRSGLAAISHNPFLIADKCNKDVARHILPVGSSGLMWFVRPPAIFAFAWWADTRGNTLAFAGPLGSVLLNNIRCAVGNKMLSSYNSLLTRSSSCNFGCYYGCGRFFHTPEFT